MKITEIKQKIDELTEEYKQLCEKNVAIINRRMQIEKELHKIGLIIDKQHKEIEQLIEKKS